MRTLLYTLISFVLWSASANATSVGFVQDGWSPGGPLTIAFSGNDTDANGTLEQLELSAFHARWITPLGDVMNWTRPDIEPDGFLFTDPENYLFFTRNPDFFSREHSVRGRAARL